MTKTINECISGLKKGIIDAGLSSATSDNYCRTIIALVRKSKYSLDDDCTEFVIEDLLKISDDQHQHKNIIKLLFNSETDVTAGYIPFTGNGVLKANLCVIQSHENDAEEEIHTQMTQPDKYRELHSYLRRRTAQG